MNPSLPLALVGLFVVGTASAATIVQTQNFAFIPTGSQVLTFNEFDTLGGTRTLLSVSVTVEFTKSGGTHSVDNDSDETGTINLTHQVIGSLTSTKSLVNTLGQTIGGPGTLVATSTLNVTVGETSGDPVDEFNNTLEDDYVFFAPEGVSDSDSGTILGAFQDQYVGTDTFTMTFSGNQIVNATGLGGLQQSFTVSNVSGSVTVTYEYVPEPSTALLGAAGLLFILRRRRI